MGTIIGIVNYIHYEVPKMTIKEIRGLTGLSQVDFGEYYNIPLPTIKKWESKPDKKNHRSCPLYVNQLLERVVKIDFPERR